MNSPRDHRGLACSTPISMWLWSDAPIEYRSLSPFGPEDHEESVILLPPGTFDDDGFMWLGGPRAMAFYRPDHPDAKAKYGGEDWGWYSFHELPDGFVVIITAASHVS